MTTKGSPLGFNNKHSKERRGVAPIIATLLMVAVAVVGGILIFVFAQGFFGTTSDLSVGGTSILKVTGYDARDTTALRTHDGTSLTVNAAADGMLDSGEDAVFIYVRNAGTQSVTISSVEVNDVSHSTLSTSAWDDSPIAPSGGSFSLTTSSLTPESDAVIEGGEQMTIMVRYNGGDLNNSRNTAVKVVTSDGGEFSIPITVGQRET
jgi:flagellin-like protein